MKRILFVLVLLNFALGTALAACPSPSGAIMINPPVLDFGTVQVGTSAGRILSIYNIATSGNLKVTRIAASDAHFTLKSPSSVPACFAPGQSVRFDILFTPTANGRMRAQLRIDSSAPGQSKIYVDVTGVGTGAAAQFVASPASLNFGDVTVGQNTTKMFTIVNQGTMAGVVDQVVSNNSAFTVMTLFPRTIAPGGQTSVNVKFFPADTGAASATLSIKSGGKTVASVGATGVGKGGNPDISILTHLDFGTMDIGTYRDAMLDIRNVGNSDLHIGFVLPSNVKLNPSGPLVIGPGRTAQLEIGLIADATGPISKIIKLLTNDPDESHPNLTLNANGVKGKLGLLVRSTIANDNDTTGVQWVDYNGDGKEDLYVTGHNGNVLFKNLGAGRFANVTPQARVGNMGNDSRGASWADIDNDGDADLFISNFNGPSAVLKNNKGVFANQGGSLGLFTADNTSSSQAGIWLDFNNDGRLDLFIVKSGRPNQLFKQVGLFRFVNVSLSAGLALNSDGRSAVAADFNNDGYQDLYIANFDRPNKLYVNNKNETFRDVTQSAGVGFTGASEQVTVSDYDGDGDFDLFIANSDGASILYRNTGNLKFQNATANAGLQGPRSATSASFTDFDNDGDQDLLIAQSHGENVLYRNIGGGKFVKVVNVDITTPSNASSTSSGDSNNNGAPDVVIGGSDGSGDSVYDNTGGAGNNWLVLVLQGTESNRSAIGAKVVVRAGAGLQAKVISAGNGQSQDSLPLEFGLGGATTAQVIIAWPSGRTQVLQNIPVNQQLRIMEPAS